MAQRVAIDSPRVQPVRRTTEFPEHRHVSRVVVVQDRHAELGHIQVVDAVVVEHVFIPPPNGVHERVEVVVPTLPAVCAEDCRKDLNVLSEAEGIFWVAGLGRSPSAVKDS